ncbi:MAG: acetamidase/formamidase family protein [Thermomicrobiales bacterium]
MARISREHYTYRFAPDVPPVARVRPGEEIIFETYDASTGRIRTSADVHTYLQVRDVRRVNPAAGPVWVEGARPGDELVVTIEAIRLTDQGYIRAMPDDAILTGIAGPVAVIVPVEYGDTLLLPGGLRLPARPMVGVIGVAPASGDVLTAVPGPIGSNLDCNLVRAGARVHLPVQVAGALLALGDVHASMGDGEVSGTGVEINAEVTARVEVLPGAAHARPWIEVDGLIAATASAPALTDAVSLATEGLVTLLMERHGVSRTDAFLLVSAYGDVRIGQACAPGGIDATVYACFPALGA